MDNIFVDSEGKVDARQRFVYKMPQQLGDYIRDASFCCVLQVFLKLSQSVSKNRHFCVKGNLQYHFVVGKRVCEFCFYC